MAMTRTDSLREKKSLLIAYLMWGLGFVGIGGMHRFYLGQNGVGVALLVTFGGCGIGQLLDVTRLSDSVKIANGEKAKTERMAEKIQHREERSSAKTPAIKETDVRSESIAMDDFDELMADQEELQKRLRGFKE